MASAMLRRTFLSSVRPNRLSFRSLVELANKENLPGSMGANFPKYLSSPLQHFPFVVTAESVDVSMKATPGECAEAVKEQFQSTINEYGAILYRGFPLNGPKDFSDFLNGLAKFEVVPYIGGAAPRTPSPVGDGVYTASDEPPEMSIEPHNEMAYMHIWPDVISFYCKVPAKPGCGGETAIVNVREILKNLDKSVAKKFKDLGIYYHYHWSDENTGSYKSWQEVFMTKEQSDVEKYLLENEIEDFEWQKDGSLVFGYKRSAFTIFPVTGESLWFNHAHRKHGSYWKFNHPHWKNFPELPYHKFPTHTYYGDKTDIPEDVIQHIRDVTWKAAVGFQMQHGEVLALENHLVMHARLSFTGERKLLASLLKYAT